MTYIYPITDPEILKLGIRMALYREKKPEYLTTDFYPQPNYSSAERQMDNAIIVWEQSFIAYLKEPEFKEGDIAWHPKKGKREIIKVSLNMKGKLLIYVGKLWYYPASEFSHYYPGQEVESFKYVRKVHIYNPTEIYSEESGEMEESLSRYEWQEVEEPAEPKYIESEHFNSISTNWLLEDRKAHEKWYKLYIQFQEGVKQAKILAEI